MSCLRNYGHFSFVMMLAIYSFHDLWLHGITKSVANSLFTELSKYLTALRDLLRLRFSLGMSVSKNQFLKSVFKRAYNSSPTVEDWQEKKKSLCLLTISFREVFLRLNVAYCVFPVAFKKLSNLLCHYFCLTVFPIKYSNMWHPFSVIFIALDESICLHSFTFSFPLQGSLRISSCVVIFRWRKKEERPVVSVLSSKLLTKGGTE